MAIQSTRGTQSTSTPQATSSTTSAPTAGAPPEDDSDVEVLGDGSTTTPTAAARSTPQEVKSAEDGALKAMDQRTIGADAADAALLGLIKLKNADLGEVVTRLATDKPEQFAALWSAAPESTRDTLLRRLSHAGVLSQTPPMTPPDGSVGPRAPTPPTGPALFNDNADLPGPLRDAALQRNLTLVNDYKRQFQAYREEYRAAVDDAPSVAALRALGPMAQPALPENIPSTSRAYRNDSYNAAYLDARGRTVEDNEMQIHIADRVRMLTGRPVAGLSLSLKGSALVTLSGITSFGGSVGISRDAAGNISGSASASGSVTAAGMSVSGSVNHQGKVAGRIGGAAGDGSVSTDGEVVNVGITNREPPRYGSSPDPTPGTAPAPDNVAVNVRVGAHHVGASVGRGGKSLGVDIDNRTGLTIATGQGPLSSTSTFNGDSISQMVRGELRMGDPEDAGFVFSAEATATAQGVTEVDRAGFVSTSDVGFYDTPPELEAGKKWSSLPSSTRMAYEAQGWTEAEWQSRKSLKLNLAGLR